MSPYDPYCPDCKIGAACGLSNSQHRRVRKAKKRADKQAIEVRTQELVAAEYPGARLTQLYTRTSGGVSQGRLGVPNSLGKRPSALRGPFCIP